MKTKLALLFLFISFISNAQVYSIGMDVSKSELEASSYARDSSANAVIIYDYGNAYYNRDSFKFNLEVKQKVKILSSEGLDRGDISIRLYKNKSSKELIKDILAITYNIEDGTVVKTQLSESSIFTESNEYYDDVKIVLPNLKVGSIFTISYRKTTPFSSKFFPWYFQGVDPVVYSEYNTSIPGNYEYNIKLVGNVPLYSQAQDIEHHCLDGGRGATANCATAQYIMKDIPAYKEESHTTTSSNYISRIEYELAVFRNFDGSVKKYTKSWKDVDKEMYSDSDFGRQINKKSLVKNLLSEEIKSTSDPLEKAQNIYQFVLDNYRWDKTGGLYDASVKGIINDGAGNAVELNLLLLNLLNSENIEVYPILISTRDNGLPTKVYPVITDFNYLIVKAIIGEKSFLLDATNQYQPFGQLPFYCLNQYGRLFDFDTASYWQDISDTGYSTSLFRAELSLTEEKKISGNLSHKRTGYKGIGPRQRYFENPETYVETMRSSYRNITIVDHTSKTLTKNDKNFDEVYNVILEDEFTADKIYLNPIVFKFFDENPFKLQERTYPIDFGYKSVYMYTMELDLKDQLKVVEMPKNEVKKLPNNVGSVIFNSSLNGSKLTVLLKIKLDQPIYSVSYYDSLKQFMNAIIEIQNNSLVVLEKQ